MYFLVGLFGVLSLHVATNYLLPYPFREINVIFLFLLWNVVFRDKQNYLWLGFALSLVTELFTSLPFGVTTFSVIVSILIVQRIFQVIFTNYSWYSIFLLAIIGIIFLKLIAFSAYAISLMFQKQTTSIAMPNLYTFLIELILNAGVFLFTYAIYSLLAPRKRYYNI